jgi:hypothetical protein
LGPSTFVDVRQLTVTDPDASRGAAGTARREWLFMHPPATVSVDVAVPARRQVWLQAALTLDPAVWNAEVGDGVRFQATVRPVEPSGPGDAALLSAGTLVIDEPFNPRARTEQRRWVPVVADLSRWGGTTIRLTLTTLPRDEASFDWAGWGDPIVVVMDTARDPLSRLES